MSSQRPLDVTGDSSERVQEGLFQPLRSVRDRVQCHCPFSGCTRVYQSRKKFSSHCIKRHVYRVIDQADVVAFFEKGQPLPQVISGDHESSTSDSSEEDEEQDTSDTRATAEQSYPKRRLLEQYNSPSIEQVCLERSESAGREADNSTTSSSSTCGRLKDGSEDGERDSEGKTEEVRYDRHIQVSKSTGTPVKP